MFDVEEMGLLLVGGDRKLKRDVTKCIKHLKGVVSLSLFTAENEESTLQVLSQHPVEIILMDIEPPDGNRLQLIRNILSKAKAPAVIVVVNEDNEPGAIEAMSCGAMDYLVKGAISSEALQRSIINGREKVHMKRALEQQRLELIKAEQQRVMLESLGAACHHLGQPATVIMTYLELLQQQHLNKESKPLLDECQKAVNRIQEILERFQAVQQYQTEPYCTPENQTSSEKDLTRTSNILKI